jgi:hypothetical protein
VYTLVIIGFATWEGHAGPVPVRFQASDLTSAQCEEGRRTIPRSIQNSWGRKIRFTSITCKKG